MAYTVKELSKLAGVSIRTLHWYDEVGLLKPAYYGDNGYRYYEEEQLLLLQQILFFRELDLPLDEIRKVVTGSEFDKVNALNIHKKALRNSLERTKKLIKTIDKTLLHLGGKKMKSEEFFYGFDSEKQKAYEKELKQILKEKDIKVTDDLFDKSRAKNWSKKDWDSIHRGWDEIHTALVDAIKQGLKPESDEVQAITAKHFTMIEKFYTPTKEIYMGLGDLYCEHPDFQKFFAAYHIDLANYLRDAMHIFAERKWPE